MTVQEFNNQFEVLYNNITSNQAPGLDAYEKSVFLTKAQDELVKNYFSATTNPNQQGFDGSPKRHVDFSTLVRTEEYDLESSDVSNKEFTFNLNGKDVSKAIFILNERVQDKTTGKRYTVVPLSYVDYDRLSMKPFPYPPKRQAWRVFIDGLKALLRVVLDDNHNAVYIIRYVVKPTPIILEDLGDLSIDGYSSEQTSSLPIEIHEEILQRAVELAKAAWAGDLNTEITLGERSE